MWEQVHTVSEGSRYHKNWYTRSFNETYNRWLESTGLTRENIRWIENEYGQTTQAQTVKTIAYYLHEYGLWDVATALKIGSVVAMEFVGGRAAQWMYRGAQWGLTGVYTLYRLGVIDTGIQEVIGKVLKPIWAKTYPIFLRFGFAKFMHSFATALRRQVKNIRNTRTYSAGQIRAQMREAYPKWKSTGVSQKVTKFKTKPKKTPKVFDDFRTTTPKGIVNKIGDKAGRRIEVPPMSPSVATVVDTILQAIQEASKAIKYQSRIIVPHFESVVSELVKKLPDMARDQLDRVIRKELKELFSDKEIKDTDMPYIRKWVPFIRRRRRYGYGRRYSGYGYNRRRRSYRRY